MQSAYMTFAHRCIFVFKFKDLHLNSWFDEILLFVIQRFSNKNSIIKNIQYARNTSNASEMPVRTSGIQITEKSVFY